MVQVTMSGPEYAELLTQTRKMEEMVELLVRDRKVVMDEKNCTSYSAGDFPTPAKYPEWLNKILLKDMEDQLFRMDEETFTLWVQSDKPYYNPQERGFRNSLYRNDGFHDMREFSAKIKDRWNYVSKKIAPEIVEEAIENV